MCNSHYCEYRKCIYVTLLTNYIRLGAQLVGPKPVSCGVRSCPIYFPIACFPASFSHRPIVNTASFSSVWENTKSLQWLHFRMGNSPFDIISSGWSRGDGQKITCFRHLAPSIDGGCCSDSHSMTPLVSNGQECPVFWSITNGRTLFSQIFT